MWSAGRIMLFILAGYGLSLLLIFYSPIADYLVAPLGMAADRKPAPAIIVLTAWTTSDGVLSEEAMRRTHMAARLYREGLAPLVIISGGEATGELRLESADFMGQFANELGIPWSAILLEKKSRNTYTSAIHVRALCREMGIDRALLVTDAAHMRRAVAAFRAQQFLVYPVPADPWSVDWESPLARMKKFLAAMHEYGGLMYYRWNGWI